MLLAIAAPAWAAADRSSAVADVVKTNVTLAQAAASAGSPADAAAMVRRAASAKLGKLTDGEVVVALLALSDRSGQDDRLADALHLGEHALSITRTSALGPALEFDSLTRTGSAHYMLDDYDTAARDLDAARKAAARIEPFDANSVANATANYAVTLDEAGRYREAQTALHDAIALRARAAEQRPVSIAVAWLALAAVNKRLGRTDLSEENYRTGLALLEKAGKTAEPTYGLALHNYGVLTGETGRDAEAAALYRRAIELAPADRKYAPSMVNNYTSLAAAWMALGRLDDAGRAVTDAERAAAAKPKPDTQTINILSARAQLSGRRDDRAAAERDADAAVVLARRAVAPTSIRLADGLITLSDALLRNGKPVPARVAADEAVAIGASLPDRTAIKAIAYDTRAATLVAGDPVAALADSRTAAEIQARRFAEEGSRTPAPLQPEERGIVTRRIALLWEVSRR